MKCCDDIATKTVVKNIRVILKVCLNCGHWHEMVGDVANTSGYQIHRSIGGWKPRASYKLLQDRISRHY